jgi:hypothetical protein
VARYLIYDDALGIVLSSHAVASSTTVDYGCVHGTKGVNTQAGPSVSLRVTHVGA